MPKPSNKWAWTKKNLEKKEMEQCHEQNAHSVEWKKSYGQSLKGDNPKRYAIKTSIKLMAF